MTAVAWCVIQFKKKPRLGSFFDSSPWNIIRTRIRFIIYDSNAWKAFHYIYFTISKGISCFLYSPWPCSSQPHTPEYFCSTPLFFLTYLKLGSSFNHCPASYTLYSLIFMICLYIRIVIVSSVLPQFPSLSWIKMRVRRHPMEKQELVSQFCFLLVKSRIMKRWTTLTIPLKHRLFWALLRIVHAYQGTRHECHTRISCIKMIRGGLFFLPFKAPVWRSFMGRGGKEWLCICLFPLAELITTGKGLLHKVKSCPFSKDLRLAHMHLLFSFTCIQKPCDVQYIAIGIR